MKHETSVALHEYWKSCGSCAGVAAGDIRAGELKPLLGSLFLLDLSPEAGFRFQYCGSALTARYGRDLTGQSFLSLWTGADRNLLEDELGSTGGGLSGLVVGVLGETAGGGFTSFEMLLLPIGSTVRRAGAIGSMVRIGGHEDVNRIRARLVGQSVQSLRFLPPIGFPPPRRETGPALALPAAPRSEVRRRYRHLTLLQGGKAGQSADVLITDP